MTDPDHYDGISRCHDIVANSRVPFKRCFVMNSCAQIISDPAIAEIRKHRDAFIKAVECGRSAKWKLHLWSKFIRCRDEGRCINCGSIERVQAHHVVRKVLNPQGALETGNGISLCSPCHKKVHAQFNRRPNLALPLGAEQGDDQDEWAYLFGLLKDNAQSRGLPENEFYFLEDHMLMFFVKVQGYEQWLDLVADGSLSRIRFAHEIWRNMPEAFYSNFASGVVREFI